MNVTFTQLRDWLTPLVGHISAFDPIGNHELKRHLVYKVSCQERVYVLKLYYKKDRWNREVANLRRFAGTEVLAPRMVDYGVFESGLEWLLYDFIEGDLLSRVDAGLALDNREAIYFEMGGQLGLIHQHKLDFFGSMDENGHSISGFNTFKEYFSQLVAKILTELHTVEHDDPLLMREAESRFLSMLDAFDEEPEATLCHNDFGPRNILVSDTGGQYYLKAVIDFEQSVPTDRDEELISVYLPLLEQDKQLASRFRAGYEQYQTIDMERLLRKRTFYNLFRGLGICSWSKEVNYAYYTEGVRLLRQPGE